MSFYGYVHNYQGEGQANQAGEYVGGVKDATMSRLYEAFHAATSQEARIPIMKEFDDYIMRQHFQVYGHKAPNFQLAHPWVKGWNGETTIGDIEQRGSRADLARPGPEAGNGVLTPAGTRSNGRGVAGTTCRPATPLSCATECGGELTCGRI